MLPSLAFLKFADELCSYALLGLAIFDSCLNHNWRRYGVLWVIMAIMSLYALYSLPLSYNSPAAIAKDWIIQLKPFIPFAVVLAIGPALTGADKRVLRISALATTGCILTLLIAGNQTIKSLIVHITYCGIGCFVSAIVYLYCSIKPDGTIARKALYVVTAMLIIGLGCTRAKYFGLFVIAVFMLYAYRPEMFRRLSVTGLGLCLVTVILVLAVSWHKIQYYFLMGEGTNFDPNIIESYARPVMYATGALVLVDHLPFGSGLASFGSYVSGESYSALYHQYGIDNVYGLSPTMSEFICDAFYPSLAQFGIAGIIIFIWFWCYIYGFLRHMQKADYNQGRYYYIAGILIIACLSIESIASTTFVQPPGMIMMMFMALICHKSVVISGYRPMPYKPIRFIQNIKIVT